MKLRGFSVISLVPHVIAVKFRRFSANGGEGMGIREFGILTDLMHEKLC